MPHTVQTQGRATDRTGAVAPASRRGALPPGEDAIGMRRGVAVVARRAHGIVIVRFPSSSAIRRLVRRRIAFIDYLPTHYRRALYEELGRRMDADFYFYADERERYWNKALSLVGDGRFRRVELRRFRIAGEAFMPGIVRT